MHIPTLLIYGEERARKMAGSAQFMDKEYHAAQFRELAELFYTAKVAYDDFVHDNLVEQS